MNPDVKARWVAALRSGEYEQGRGFLRFGDQFCCLGVLCDIAKTERVVKERRYKSDLVVVYMGPDGDESEAGLPLAVARWAGLLDKGGDPVPSPWDARGRGLAAHNDSGSTFAEIADVIERDL